MFSAVAIHFSADVHVNLFISHSSICLSITVYLFIHLTLRTSEAGIPALRKHPCGVTRRYTGFAQTSPWRCTPVYRLCANFPMASHDGIPALFSKAYWPQNARVIEIQTRQKLKNNLFHETQRIFVNNFCIWTPSSQRTS